jgi:hypothetical protein
MLEAIKLMAYPVGFGLVVKVLFMIAVIIIG